MILKNFLKLVEIQTKAASVIPFMMGTAFAYFRYHTFSFTVFIIMFLSLFTFDMATTAINNYVDYNYVNFKVTTVRIIILILLSTATFFGILLTLKTNIVVLTIGIISFFAGIFYTYGPIPISRMPLGEIFSGFFMGFIITFLSVYVQAYGNNIVSLILSGNILNVSLNLPELIYIFLFSVPAVNCIANIMLANNICDLEDDILIKRFTLPYYIGMEKSLKLFKYLYYISYLDILLLAFLGITPVINLAALITFIPVYRNIRLFTQTPVKSKTFVLSVKNFMLVNLPQAVFISISIFAAVFIH